MNIVAMVVGLLFLFPCRPENLSPSLEYCSHNKTRHNMRTYVYERAIDT